MDVPRKKDLALLAYLVVERGQAHGRAGLAALLWGDSPEEKARHSLGQALRRLRELTGEDALGVHGAGVSWDGEVGCDAHELAACADAACEAALSVYPGDFLSAFSPGPGAEGFEAWADRKRAELRHVAVRLFERLGEQAERDGRWGDALQLGLKLGQVEPVSEASQRRIMRSWAALGERRLALRTFEQFTAWLAEEIGAEPDEETRRLAAALAAGTGGAVQPDRPLAAAPAAAPSAGPVTPETPPTSAPQPASVPASSPAPADRSAAEPGALVDSGRRRRGLLRGAVVAFGILTAAGVAAVHAWRGADDRVPWPLFSVLSASGEERIVFASDRSGKLQAYTMRPSGSDVRPLPNPFDTAALPRLPSPDGRFLAFGRRVAGDAEVFVIRTDEGDSANITRRMGQDNAGVWSPDGRRLLIVSWRNGNADIFLVNPDGSDPRQLTRDPADDDAPCWSPTGDAIAFRSRRGGIRELWVMDADGRRQHRVAAGVEVAGCSFSPDGRRLAFVDRYRGSPGDLYVITDDGRPPHLVLHGVSGRFLWSPDGEWLAIGMERSGDAEIYRVRFDGAFAENVSRDTARDLPLAWLPARTRYIDRVRILPTTSIPLRPGEKRALRARAFDAAGRYFYGPRLRWESTNPGVATVDTDGVVTATAAGEAGIIASAGGWRADTLSVLVEARAATLLMREDFERGIDPRVWMPYGTPASYVVAGIGTRESHGFVNNGDDYYESGVFSRRRFATREGLTVEFSAKAPITAPLHQSLTVDLLDADLAEPARNRGDVFGGRPIGVLRLSVGGFGRDGRPLIFFGSLRLPFPAGESPADWHRYRVQLRPDGWQELFIDERPIAAAPPFPNRSAAPAIRVFLGSRSFGTRLVHDDLAVYAGLRSPSP